MSGLQMTPENTNIASIIEQIKASQQKVLQAFEDHNSLVNKSLELLQQLKTETKVEVIKVKDPLEEIKKINEQYKDREFYGYLSCLVMINIVDTNPIWEQQNRAVWVAKAIVYDELLSNYLPNWC